jgi:phospholipase C
LKITQLIFSLLLAIICFDAYSADSLKVASWNVFLRPAILNDNQLERVQPIAEKIIELDPDVIVLQEVFHKKARKKLIASLESHYPYFTTRGKRSWLGVSSGLLIMSKYPITHEQFKYFKKAKKADAIAKKGFVTVKLRFKKRNVRILGTHLQAGSGKKIKTVRKSQLKQIASNIQSDSSNWILAGDFNVERNGPEYRTLKEILGTKNQTPCSKLKASANFNNHRLYPAEGKPKWIDFVLLRSKKWKHHRTIIISPKKGKKMISDHAILLSIITI